jgi:hypothetical protein
VRFLVVRIRALLKPLYLREENCEIINVEPDFGQKE